MNTLLRSRINSIIVLISTLLFSSVFFAQGTLLVTANGNPVNSGPLPTATSTINFTDFGNVEIGSSLQHIFVLDNTGGNGNPNQLNGITAGLSGSSNFSLSNTSLGNLAGNGGTINLTITYSPTSNIYETANVTISFSNGTNAPYTFTIDGSGIMPTPEIEIEDSGNNIIANNTSFDFGTITPNSISSETFSIKNTSVNATTLTLEGINPNYITISGDSEFSITNQPGSNTISGGSSESFTIAYSPTAVGGPHSATISIDNDDPDDGEDPYTFTVTGLSDNIIYTPTTSGPDWNVTNITPDNELNYPNTIIYGPDNYLWITERVGKQVVKVDPVNGGNKSVMLDLTSVVYQTAGQDGLMGMAVHPDLYNDINTSNNLVYLAYTYDSGGRKLRIESYRYISSTGTLDASSATTILEGFDASNDHNSGKLQIGPDMKLYYTAGDQGYNQFQNACLEIRAQYLPTSPSDYSDYKGKILRMNLDGSIPSDNPILNSVQSHVYTYGHRNPQGIVFGSNGSLYSSEHGPKVDDEINIITAGKNYGWPQIAGYYDNLGYGYCNWSSSGSCNPADFSDHNCATGVTPIPEFTSGQPVDFQEPIGTYNSTTAVEPSGGWLTWPTVGPSSIDIYESNTIPDWNQSLLIPTLKRGTIFRVKLNASGTALESQTYEEFHSSNDRYRDICISPDGSTIYAITDNTGGTSGPSGTTSVSIENPGVIVKIRYVNCPDDDGDGICNADDICPGFDDTADSDSDGVSDCIDLEIPSPCPLDVDASGVSNDDDNDGVANCLDICPGFDDNLDTDLDGVSDCIDLEIPSPCPLDVDANGVSNDDDNDGIPNCLDETCTFSAISFAVNPLTHLGTGSSSTSQPLPPNSQDISFTISGIDAVENGKPSSRFTEQVDVFFIDENGTTQFYDTFLGTNSSTASIDIPGVIQSIIVTLSDALNNNSGATLSINFSPINYCDLAPSGSKTALEGSKKSSITSSYESPIKIYPNPASSNLHIDNTNAEKITNFYMYNVTGQLVNSTVLKNNKQIIDVSDLAKGLYLIRVVDKNKNTIVIKQIIIN